MAAGVCLLLIGLPAAAPAQSEQPFKTVPARAMKENPAFFWAQGLVFSDTLEAVTGGTDKIDDKKYRRIKTTILGDCYIDEGLSNVLSELAVGETYLFSGTVVQKKGLLRRSKHTYRYLITGVTLPMDAIEQMSTDIQKLATRPVDRVESPEMQAIGQVVSLIEQRLFAESEQSGVPVEDMFVPGSENRGRVNSLILNLLRQLENQQNVQTSALMAGYIGEVLAQRYQGDQPAPTDPMTEDQPAPEDAPPPGADSRPTDPSEGLYAPVGMATAAAPIDPLTGEPITAPKAPEVPEVPTAEPVEEEPALDEPVMMAEEETAPIAEMVEEAVEAMPEAIPEPLPEPEPVVAEAIPEIDDLEDLDAALEDLEIPVPMEEPEPIALDLPVEPETEPLDDLDAALAELESPEPMEEPAPVDTNVDTLDLAKLDEELASLEQAAAAAEPMVEEAETGLDDLDAALASLDEELATTLPEPEAEAAMAAAPAPAVEDELADLDLEDLDAALADLEAAEAPAPEPVMAVAPPVVVEEPVAFDELDAALEDILVEEDTAPPAPPPTPTFTIGPFRFPVLTPPQS